jgi:hypothetical protein
MKLYYNLGQYDNLKKIIENLKKSGIQLSYETLNMIRFWAG